MDVGMEDRARTRVIRSEKAKVVRTLQVSDSISSLSTGRSRPGTSLAILDICDSEIERAANDIVERTLGRDGDFDTTFRQKRDVAIHALLSELSSYHPDVYRASSSMHRHRAGVRLYIHLMGLARTCSRCTRSFQTASALGRFACYPVVQQDAAGAGWLDGIVDNSGQRADDKLL